MARTNNNKYTSINFNHILEKNVTTASTANPGKANYPQNPQQHPSSFSSSYSSISSPSNAKTHGRMLVLIRPTTKPLTVTPPLSPSAEAQRHQQTEQVQHRLFPDQAPKGLASDQISLRPLSRTGSGLCAASEAGIWGERRGLDLRCLEAGNQSRGILGRLVKMGKMGGQSPVSMREERKVTRHIWD
ncbi:hypothetical protein SLEP1_g6642 [Rubroshorea leprosula]|uniref:Uncharacterized protein n=1 Tax=Rubroshorea leprosula TaxID=152421 RepID=A0AAV5I6T0_9ROSI|nr:hypothetical protein SLEP1_g6642 [Rubroshorea leprosula]